MRLQEMYHFIQNSLKNWVEPEFSKIDVDNICVDKSQYYCTNRRAILEELIELLKLPSFEGTVIALILDDDFPLWKDYYTDEEKGNIKSKLKNIYFGLRAIKSMCDELGVEANSAGFDVKLPPDITLSDLSSCAKDLDTIFSQCPILKLESSEIRLRGVDVGSAWLTFTLIGTGALATITILKNLAALVDNAVMIRSHWITCNQQEETLKKTQMSNEMLESLTEAHKMMLDRLCAETVENLAASHNISGNEDKERLDYSLKLLSEWMGRGLEIYSAIDVPSDVKAVFPPLEMQSLPITQPQLLKSESESTDSE